MLTQREWHTAPPEPIRMSSGPHDRPLIIADKVLCRHTVPNRTQRTGLHPGRRSPSKQDYQPPDSPPDDQSSVVPTRTKGKSAQDRRSRRPSSKSAPGEQPGAILNQRARYQATRKGKNTRFAHDLGVAARFGGELAFALCECPPGLCLV